MKWQVHRVFTLHTNEFFDHLLIYHEGTGMTHCLSGFPAELFRLILKQTDGIITDKDLESYCDGFDFNKILSDLCAMNVVQVIEL